MNHKLIITVLLSLVLAACSTAKKEETPPVDTTDTTPVVDNNAFGTGYSIAELEDLGIIGNPLDYKTVYFEYNSSAIDEKSRVIVAAHARNVGNSIVSLAGHADERGTRDFNLALGERRANAVSDLMKASGASSAIQTISYGEERPADPAHNEAAWQLNRRVEISY